MKNKNLLTIAYSVLICLGIIVTGTIGKVQAYQIINGETASLGNGTVRSWAKLGNNGQISSIGVTFSKAALSGLPTTADAETKNGMMRPGGYITYETQLALPIEAVDTAFDNIVINWNPEGHERTGLYSVPHFDFHFYTISPQEREEITATGDDLEKVYQVPLPEFLPKDYVPISGEGGEAGMGWHVPDINTPELNGQPFSKTFYYGFYDGKISFEEPMLTNAYLKTKPNFTEALKLPDKYAKSGYYPTAYSVKYDQASKEYTISLDKLTFRPAATTSVSEASSIPGHSYYSNPI